VTKLRAGWSGVRIPTGARDFSQNIRPALGTHPASYSIGIRGNFPRVEVGGLAAT